MMKLRFIIFLSLWSFCLSAQRNTIFIIADDLSPDFFGFYENHGDTVDVPNIRSLLAKGVRFKHLMTNPVCSSTRSTMLTGRYGFRTGVGGIVGGEGGSGQLDTNEISIPKLLKQYNATIAKANIGKWHLKQPTPAINLKSPLALGYDHFEGPFIGQLPSFTNWTKYTNGISGTVTNYATSENVNNAVSWLKSINASHPFFLWLAFNAPHEPLHLPPANLHSFNTLSGTQTDINAQPKAYFKAMIQAMDHEIGRLFDSLKVMHQLDSTDFIFIGDNGSTPRTAQTSDLTKAKGTVYEYGVHTPFIFSGPSVVNPGRSSDALVNTVDLFATIVENFGYTNWRSGIHKDSVMDSQSLQPIIKNQTDSVRAWIFTELFKLTADSSEAKAIRNRNYKLIRFNDGREEFYDLVADPNEQHPMTKDSISPLKEYCYLNDALTDLTNKGNFCMWGGLQKAGNADNEPAAYPVPFGDQLHLAPKYKGLKVEMVDVSGKVLYSGTEIEREDFKDLILGVYFLRFQEDGEVQVIKLIHK